MIRGLFTLVPLLHLYIGLRLLPDMRLDGLGLCLGILTLAASAVLIPMAMMSRGMPNRQRADRIAWTGFVTMGLLSSILVLTVARDLCLIVGAAAGFIIDNDAAMRSFRDWSAAFVPVFAVLLSALGFVNARRRAAVRSVDIPIAGLPAALHGFNLAQITDVHVGAPSEITRIRLLRK